MRGTGKQQEFLRMQTPGLGHTFAAAHAFAWHCCCSQRGEAAISMGWFLPPKPGSPSGEVRLSLLTAEEAEDGDAAGKVPQCRSDASASGPYLCWEMRCALTSVVRCSANRDKAVVVLMRSSDRRRSWVPLLPAVN